MYISEDMRNTIENIIDKKINQAILPIIKTLISMKTMISHLHDIKDESDFGKESYRCPSCERMMNTVLLFYPSMHADDCKWGQLIKLCAELEDQIDEITKTLEEDIKEKTDG